MIAAERLVAALENAGLQVDATGPGSWLSMCKLHHRRLCVMAVEGAVRAFCFAGHGEREIASALGLSPGDLYDEPFPPTLMGIPAHERYHYDNGRQVIRSADKGFKQVNGDRPCQLYRLSRVQAVGPAEPVYVVEGEKDVHTLEAQGVTATCNPMGAGKWSKIEDLTPLYGKTVIIVEDKDPPGASHAEEVYWSLHGKADVRLVAPRVGKDVTDHVVAGLGVEHLAPLPAPEPSGDPRRAGGGGVPSPRSSSWAPVDLTARLDGTYAPVTPTLLPRSDGACLLYPGLISAVYGEPESGKSLLLQFEAVRLLAAGERVLWIDFEKNPEVVLARLRQMGAAPTVIAASFVYVRPEVDAQSSHGARDDWERLLGQRYALVVIDGLTNAMAVTKSGSSNDQDDVSRWFIRYPDQLVARTGAAVVILDHMPKDNAGSGRGRYALGSQHKLAALTGSGYATRMIEALGVGRTGELELRVTKDSPGWVRQHGAKYRQGDSSQVVAIATVDATVPGRLDLTLDPPKAAQTSPRPEQQSIASANEELLVQVSRVIESSPDITQSAICRSMSRKEGVVKAAIDHLVDAGYVSRTRGPNNSHRHRSIKPYDGPGPHSITLVSV